MKTLDNESEKLRSKHVRTLEILQRTVDENVELRKRIANLEKVNQGLDQELMQPLDVDDESTRIKDKSVSELKQREEAATAKLTKQLLIVETLTTTNTKLKNDMDTALRNAHDRLNHERQTWKEERAQLQATIAEMTQPQTQSIQYTAMIEEAKQRLEGELESSRQAWKEADSARLSAEALLLEAKQDMDRMSKEVSSQRDQIAALQSQLAAIQTQHKSLMEELEISREETRTLASNASKERLKASSSTKLLLHQKTLLAQVNETEERYASLERDYRSLLVETASVQQQLADEIAQHKAHVTESKSFAVHVQLKQENFQLRAQVGELKTLLERVSTNTKKSISSLLTYGSQDKRS